MHGTLEPNQYVLVDKLTPHFDSYSRGDIVVFNPILREDSCSAAGVPLEAEGKRRTSSGSSVSRATRSSCATAPCAVNGVELNEPYIAGTPRQTLTGGQSSWTVPPDRLFVMGDNRPNSTDSRQFGPICVSRRHRPRVAALLAARHPRHPADADLPTSPAAIGVAIALRPAR